MFPHSSGSMHGQSFDIMKLAAKTLVNTLGENDYLNVASFSRDVKWVVPCLDTLVQANARNKRLLFDGIDALVDLQVRSRGFLSASEMSALDFPQIANYSAALEFAYEKLEDFQREKTPEEGSECHKLIMVFSDGGTEYPGEIIEKFSGKSNTTSVRVIKKILLSL